MISKIGGQCVTDKTGSWLFCIVLNVKVLVAAFNINKDRALIANRVFLVKTSRRSVCSSSRGGHLGEVIVIVPLPPAAL